MLPLLSTACGCSMLIIQANIPCIAFQLQVYCQPIQYCRETSSALAGVLDSAPLYCYGWQQDYFEADLAASVYTQQPTTADSTATNAAAPGWKGLAAPQLVFDFDFNTATMEAFQPTTRKLEFDIQQPGLFNAVAFWFELQLDEVTQLSTNPYAAQQPGNPSTTWKQVGITLQSQLL